MASTNDGHMEVESQVIENTDKKSVASSESYHIDSDDEPEYYVPKYLEGTQHGIITGIRCVCPGCDSLAEYTALEGIRLRSAKVVEVGAYVKCLATIEKIKHLENVRKLLDRCKVSVTLEVGPEHHKIECNKALLSYFSEYFERMLYGPFKEATELKVYLPDEKYHIVLTFVKWVQTGVIDGRSLTEEARSQSPLLHEELWIFGEKYLSSNFCNLNVEFLFYKYLNGRIRPESVRYIYAINTAQPELKAFVRDVMVLWSPYNKCFRNNDHVLGEWDNFIGEGGAYMVDVVRALSGRRPGVEGNYDYSVISAENYKIYPERCIEDSNRWRAAPGEII